MMLIDLSDFENWPIDLLKLFKAEDKDGLSEFFKNKSFKTWHCTKLFDLNSVWEKGLKTLSFEMYNQEILPFLKPNLSNEDFENFCEAYTIFRKEEGYKGREYLILVYPILNK